MQISIYTYVTILAAALLLSTVAALLFVLLR